MYPSLPIRQSGNDLAMNASGTKELLQPGRPSSTHLSAACLGGLTTREVEHFLSPPINFKEGMLTCKLGEHCRCQDYTLELQSRFMLPGVIHALSTPSKHTHLVSTCHPYVAVPYTRCTQILCISRSATISSVHSGQVVLVKRLLANMGHPSLEWVPHL